jgi:hypothetical protein
LPISYLHKCFDQSQQFNFLSHRSLLPFQHRGGGAVAVVKV